MTPRINLDTALRQIEVGILMVLEDLTSGGEYATHLRPIAERTGLPRDVISATLRHLTDRGLTRFQRGLFTEDGDPAGSGYSLTAEGLAFVIEWGAQAPAPSQQNPKYFGAAHP